jgi:hypothetical protein
MIRKNDFSIGALSIPGSIATGFLSLVVFEGERAQKQPAHIRRIETKY